MGMQREDILAIVNISETLSSCQNVLQVQDLEMANNNDLTFASIKGSKEFILDIGENLETQPECCIYRVPKHLRKMNEKAYTPQVISIGPLHHFNKELRAMEKQKIRFVRDFGNRIKEETGQKFIDFIVENEEVIRKCYAEMPQKKFDKKEFIQMILYDALFIIEYLLRCRRIDTEPSMRNLKRVSVSIRTDLLLLENQLPYFVLKELYKLAFPDHASDDGRRYPPFFLLALRFVCFDMPQEEEDECYSNLKDYEFCHFTDLRRYSMIRMQHVKLYRRNYGDRELPCAVKLQESGVKFKRFKASKSLLDIRVRKLLRIPYLNSHELLIPNIEIHDDTECLFRNLMALEQCHYPDETHICNYIDIMNNLIDTESDVNLLVKAGIISNFGGDPATIAKISAKLSAHIKLSDSSYYAKDVKYLERYYKNPWTRAKVPLKRALMRNWKCTGTVAAVLLLILTLIQTICSIKSVM